MTKFRYLLLITMALSAVSCVDSDYDLSKIDSDDLTIGGEGSEFRIPLATITISTKEIAMEGGDIFKVFDEADTWLPSSLPDTDAVGAYVDVVKLNAGDATYTAMLLDQLTEEMKTDDAKCNAVAKLIFGTPKYKEAFQGYLPPNLNTPEAFAEAFLTAFRANTTIQNEAKTLASSYLTASLNVTFLPYTIENVNIDDKIVDMLTDNLDKPGNTLKIYGEVVSLLPVNVTLASPKFGDTAINFGDIQIKADATSQIAPANVTANDLRQLVDRVEISLPVILERYYKGKGFNRLAENQIALHLRLVKTGGLNLKL